MSPRGSLRIPPGDYWIEKPKVPGSAGIVISRQIDIEAHGARIVGDFREDEQSNLVNVRVRTAPDGVGDIRLMKVDGLGAFFATGGHTTIDVENQIPMAANL